MKKQINVSEDSQSYIFSLNDESVFSINRESLLFDSKKFYEAFFRGLDSKPEYEISVPDKVSKRCAHVAGEFQKIVEQTVASIEDGWFSESSKESE